MSGMGNPPDWFLDGHRRLMAFEVGGGIYQGLWPFSRKPQQNIAVVVENAANGACGVVVIQGLIRQRERIPANGAPEFLII